MAGGVEGIARLGNEIGSMGGGDGGDRYEVYGRVSVEGDQRAKACVERGGRSGRCADVGFGIMYHCLMPDGRLANLVICQLASLSVI